MEKTDLVKEIIEILSKSPIVRKFDRSCYYCPELKLAYVLSTGCLIMKIDQRFKSLGNQVLNNQANKIISRNGLECEEKDINISELELSEILNELRDILINNHVL